MSDQGLGEASGEKVARPQPGTSGAANPSDAGVALPQDIIDALLSIGLVEWGIIGPKTDEEHVADFADTLRLTREHDGTDGPQAFHGVYVEGTGRVLCHTGTSPRSGQHARVLVGAWNQLVEIAKATSPSASIGGS